MNELLPLLKSLPCHSNVYDSQNWLEDPNHYPNYAKLFKTLFPEFMLEIGAFTGYSLITALWACDSLKKVYWIDDESGQPNSNAMVVDNIRHFINLTNKQFFYQYSTQKGIGYYIADLVHVDGAHDYESVKQDLNWISSRVKTAKWIVGHDYCLPNSGVEKAVKEFCLARELSFAWSNKLTNGVFVIAMKNIHHLNNLPEELDFNLVRGD